VARIVQEAWGCAVYDHYGATEMGLGGGVDCRARSGYHAREADLYFEIVDPVTGRPVPDGETGEVVFTTLTREAMPLVRYRTGDMSRFVPGPCGCGTVLKRMAHIDERVAGRITLPGGATVCQGDFDEALLLIEGLDDFKVLIACGRERAALVLRVRSFPEGPRPDRAVILKALAGIGALAAAEAQGRLSMELAEWEDAAGISSGTAKRRIECVQKEGR
jgi:phenylacetate-coenzyme A ligase PaaK-like adenylate-forming protein